MVLTLNKLISYYYVIFRKILTDYNIKSFIYYQHIKINYEEIPKNINKYYLKNYIYCSYKNIDVCLCLSVIDKTFIHKLINSMLQNLLEIRL